MLRGPLAFAALVGTGAFDLTALEEFSVDYALVHWSLNQVTQGNGSTWDPNAPTYINVGSWGYSWGSNEPAGGDHGTLAVHARNLQLKLDNHFTFPEHVNIPRQAIPHNSHARQSLGQALAGVTVNEELHINGLTGQASFHLGSPALNLCVQVDHLPPVAQLAHDQIEQHLQQAEQIAPQIIQTYGQSLSMHVGSTQIPVLALMPPCPSRNGSVAPCDQPVWVFDPSSSAPLLVGIPHNVALKFDNYAASVGDQFSVRACEVETHSATQSMMAADPESREFIASRIAEHQRRLQALLEPAMLNTRFNFIPLELAEKMMAPAAQPCITNDLVQIPPRAAGTFQTVVFSVCSFVMGMATLGALHKKRVTPADAYHQVSA